MSIRLVTFDVTDTLVRISGGVVGKHYAKISKSYGVEMDAERLQSAFKEKYPEHSRRYPNYGMKANLTPFAWWSNLVFDCFKASGFTGDKEVLHNIAGHMYKHFSTNKGWELLPGCESTLTSLKQRGLKLGVISNFDDRLEQILVSMSVRHYFDFVMSPTELDVFKPDVEMFNRALKAADVGASQAVHVGDDIQTDYFGAKNAGFHALFLLHGNRSVPSGVEPNSVIRNLSETNTKLDEIGQSARA